MGSTLRSWVIFKYLNFFPKYEICDEKISIVISFIPQKKLGEGDYNPDFKYYMIIQCM